MASTWNLSKVGQNILLALASVAAVIPTATLAASKTYTLDADFALGALSGVNFDTVHNQLQLNTIGTTFPVMWIANAGEDSLSKFDTVNNKELARYRTWFGPSGQAGYVNHLNNAYAGPAPSRTAVDIQGNAYILNRWFANVKPVLIKVLTEGFIDRNGNGVMDTSEDTNGNGVIDAGEIKPMADLNGNGKIDANEITDERIAWVAEVGSQNGLGRSLCVGTDGNLWVGMYNERTYYKISAADGSQIAGPISTTPSAGQPGNQWTPYGCLIDNKGVLWSASLGGTLGKITNTASNTGPYIVSAYNSSFNYGIALGNNKVYLGSANIEFDPVTNTFSPIVNLNVGTSGIVVDGSGNIIGGQSSIRKVSPTGTLLWQAPLQAGGTSAIGIQVDSNNDVWQIGFASAGRMQKYRGSDGSPLGVFPVGNMPYTYSDAAGFAARNATNNTGTWTASLDGGANGTAWGKVNWNDLVPQGATVIVQVRAADTQASLPLQSYQTVSKGVDFAASGRFIQILTRLNATTDGQSPLLFDLTVSSKAAITCNIDGDGDVDSLDIALVRAGIGQIPVANDPRDADGDGRITINDVRKCTLQCTRPNCAQ